MLVNVEQEWILLETVSTNLVLRKPEYRTNPVNYRFGIQFILLLSILQTLSRGTQREYRSKSLKHSIVKRNLVFKR